MCIQSYLVLLSFLQRNCPSWRISELFDGGRTLFDDIAVILLFCEHREMSRGMGREMGREMSSGMGREMGRELGRRKMRREVGRGMGREMGRELGRQKMRREVGRGMGREMGREMGTDKGLELDIHTHQLLFCLEDSQLLSCRQTPILLPELYLLDHLCSQLDPKELKALRRVR